MRKVLSTVALVLVAVALSAALAAPAEAVNTRISISNFQWSKNAQIDLGETVTWDWIGPDTQHSVSGLPTNAIQWDSDPGGVIAHPLGDTFSVTFTEPGVYTFQCKLHNSVRGTVTVSANPGDPDSDPGPQAPLNLDLVPPNFAPVYLNGTHAGPRGKGVGMSFGMNEKGTVSTDYYKLVKRGKGKQAKWKRQYVGYDEWSAHIGNQTIAFARRSGNFAAKPARYVGFVYATDESVNSTPVTKLKFAINSKTKKK